MGKRSSGALKGTAGKGSSAEEVEGLLEEARVCLDQLEPQRALEACRAAVALDNGSLAALDALAEAALACGEAEEAKQALSRSVELSPSGGAGRYMYLGQLSDGADALAWFAKGIAGLRDALAAIDQTSGSRDELHEAWIEATNALAVGLCSVAEIYLTDACDEPDAEQTCDALTAEAVELVSRLPRADVVEPFQTRASLKLSQQDEEGAEPLLLKALDIVRRAGDDEDAEGIGEGEAGEVKGSRTSRTRGGAQSSSAGNEPASSEEPPPEMPSIELRLSLAKMLMEVGRAADALEVLQGARVEDDDSCEIRYLLCTAALLTGEVELAREEATAAIEWVNSPACPPEEREWLEQLQDALNDANDAAGGQMATD